MYINSEFQFGIVRDLLSLGTFLCSRIEHGQAGRLEWVTYDLMVFLGNLNSDIATLIYSHLRESMRLPLQQF
ncbi:hypothetical protein UNDYM_3911 [Undibacterium sp. YM2]|nr:hypothetical protein UNDYM_3911 [Undibacterium sp. YM2]